MWNGFKIFLGILIIAIVLVIIALSHARTDYKSNINYLALMEAKSSVFILTYTAKLPSGNSIGTYKAVCFSIGNGYIVALSHATNLEKRFPMAIMTNKTYWIGDDPLTLIGRYEDISLFKSDMTRPYIPFGDSDQLRYGTYVVVIGYSLAKVINVKDGVISKPKIKDEFKGMGEMAELTKRTFMMSTPLNPGDSGGIVIAFKDNKPEIVGIAAITFFMAKGINFAFRSNYVQEAIAKILEAK